MSQTTIRKKPSGENQGSVHPGAIEVRGQNTNKSTARLSDEFVIGEIISVTGSHALVMLSDTMKNKELETRLQLGTILTINVGKVMVLGLIGAMSVPAPSHDHQGIKIVEVELIGEFFQSNSKSPARFNKGVSSYPTLGDKVSIAARKDLGALFASSGSSSVRVGVVKQDVSIPATININEVFARHTAILGTTGTGKSCAVSLMLQSITDRYQNAHIVILDPHNEYSRCFGDKAVVFDPATFALPFWMLTFEELIEVLYPDRRGSEAEIEILSEMIPAVKKIGFAGAGSNLRTSASHRLLENANITIDTPTPYRLSELLSLLDKALGGLDNPQNMLPYKKLRNRLYAVSQDARYAFMFGNLSVQDTMVETLSSLFRIPVNGQPISIIELGALPAEVSQVLVSVISRLAFEFGLWSQGASPIAIVVEDAHRFAPVDRREGFSPTRKALARIAKEGRKTGVSLWVISQRPTELDATILSQCNTIFAMRLANQADQKTLRAIVPDTSTSLLSSLPSLGTGEAIAVGEGVPLPTRIRFDALQRADIPRSLTTNFTDGWSVEVDDDHYIRRIVEQWRAQRLLPPEI